MKSTTNEYKQAYEAQHPKPHEPILPSNIFQALANAVKKEESNLSLVQIHIKVLDMIKSQFMENFQQLSTEASSSNKDSEEAMVLYTIG